jgi:glycogen(starch) synthase
LLRWFDFDLDNTIYVFTSGRYEYHNKGADIFLDALAQVNQRLKADQSKVTIVAFMYEQVFFFFLPLNTEEELETAGNCITERYLYLQTSLRPDEDRCRNLDDSAMYFIIRSIMPARTNNFNVETLKGQSLLRKVRETTDMIAQQIHNRLFDSVARGLLPDVTKLISDDVRAPSSSNVIRTISVLTKKKKTLIYALSQEMITLKRRILSLKRTTLPPIVTHNMIDDHNDPILNHLRRLKLFNYPEVRFSS